MNRIYRIHGLTLSPTRHEISLVIYHMREELNTQSMAFEGHVVVTLRDIFRENSWRWKPLPFFLSLSFPEMESLAARPRYPGAGQVADC